MRALRRVNKQKLAYSLACSGASENLVALFYFPAPFFHETIISSPLEAILCNLQINLSNKKKRNERDGQVNPRADLGAMQLSGKSQALGLTGV